MTDAERQQIKEEILQELRRGKKIESKIQFANKQLDKVLAEELGIDPYTRVRIIGAVNVLRKACSGTRSISLVKDEVIDAVSSNCLSLLRTYLNSEERRCNEN